TPVFLRAAGARRCEGDLPRAIVERRTALGFAVAVSKGRAVPIRRPKGIWLFAATGRSAANARVLRICTDNEINEVEKPQALFWEGDRCKNFWKACSHG